MNSLYAKHTGRPLEQIERDMERDFFMSAEEAVKYGIIDSVITQPIAENAKAALASSK
jgi:ATP-dependent Clp protease, protease subunit